MSASRIMTFISALQSAFHQHLECAVNAGKPVAEQRHGGFVCVFHHTHVVGCPPELLMRYGEPDAKKALHYAQLCEEKARRLAQNPQHLSSWQSRDEKLDRWGGAIRVPDYIISFSGLPELADEALMLKTALVLRVIDLRYANKVADLSNNTIFRQLRP